MCFLIFILHKYKFVENLAAPNIWRAFRYLALISLAENIWLARQIAAGLATCLESMTGLGCMELGEQLEETQRAFRENKAELGWDGAGGMWENCKEFGRSERNGAS